MPFELAHFGAISAKICAAKEVVKAEPEDACKPLQGQHYDGKFVLVIRGGCMFSAKANHVSNKGGLGVFVINTDEKVEIYQRKMKCFADPFLII